MSEGGPQNAIISGKPDCPYHFDLYRVDGGQTSWFTARRGACAAGSYSRLPFSARTSRCRPKAFLVVSSFLWFRATFPRYRYDQIMRLGWKVFIPVTLVWIIVLGAWMQTPLWVWWK